MTRRGGNGTRSAFESAARRDAGIGQWLAPTPDPSIIRRALSCRDKHETLYRYRSVPLHSTNVFSVISRPQRWQCAGISSR